jgi:cobalt-zinc-cadmium efflux system membrane fusion protein
LALAACLLGGHGADIGARAAETVGKGAYLLHEGGHITVPEDSPLRRKLTVAPVGEKETERTLVVPAVVEADPARLAKIVPPLSGRITQLKVQLGERVQAGQELVAIDSADLGTAYADYDRAKALEALAQKNRDRQRDLLKISAAALKDAQQAETDYISAEVELQRAAARLQQIGVSADSKGKSRLVTVVSPISGSVIDLGAAPGAFWNDPTAALMTVADLSTVWVTASVPEKDTAFVAKGQSVSVTFPAYPDEELHGRVLFVSDVVDADTRRTKVRIPFQNPDIQLKPNMFANVTFIEPKQRLLVLPATALVLKDDSDQVFVEVQPWTFVERAVEVGSQRGSEVVVKKGLKAGERVVVKGAVLLND